MVHVYSLETDRKNEEIISSLKGYKAIVLIPEMAVFKGFLGFCFEKAGDDFSKKTNVANDFSLQWLCRVACSRNIKKSIELLRPDAKIAIASEKAIPKNILEKIGLGKKIPENSKKIIFQIAKKYSIPEISLVKYDLEQLLIEKSITAFLE